MATVKAFIRTTQIGNVVCSVRFRLTDGFWEDTNEDFFGY